MFEIESKKPEEITITTKQTSVIFNVAQFLIDANLPVGKIKGPGEFEQYDDSRDWSFGRASDLCSGN
mgnify:CR=1 FL=1